MKASDLLKFAITGLRRRTARTFLTVLGVIIGTICIVLMLAIGISNYQQTTQSRLEDRDLLQIQMSYNSLSGNENSNAGIQEATIASIAGMKHVKAVSPVISIPAILHAGSYEANLDLKAIDPSVLDLDFAQGGMFPQSSAMPYIVLSGNSLEYFIDPENPPKLAWEEMYKYMPDFDFMNSEVEMKLGYSWDPTEDDPEAATSQLYRAGVSGITQRSFSMNAYNSYIPLETGKRLITENREIAQQYGLRTNAFNEAIIIVDEIDNVMPVLEDIRKLGFQVYSETEGIQQAQEDAARQQAQLFAIGFISLFVSAIGIANTMYANILERRRDIGVMKVLGMKIRKIRSLFILESALIGLLGGIIGIAASYIVVLIMNTGGEQMFMGMYLGSGMKIQIPPWLSLMAMGIAIGVGVLSGIYPAYKATKMSPLEAMRN